MRARDLTGQIFGKLTALRRVGSNKHGVPLWECLCACGKTTQTTSSYLVCGDTTSCGCTKREAWKHGITHGLSKTRESIVLHRMKARCRNPRHVSYPDYGARGIRVCERWLHGDGKITGLECFIADVGLRPSPRHTIERMDVNGNYEPGNCRWVLAKEQNRNTRASRVVTFNGEERCLADWCEALNLPYNTIRWRLSHGWGTERAFTQAVKAMR